MDSAAQSIRNYARMPGKSTPVSRSMPPGRRNTVGRTLQVRKTGQTRGGPGPARGLQGPPHISNLKSSRHNFNGPQKSQALLRRPLFHPLSQGASLDSAWPALTILGGKQLSAANGGASSCNRAITSQQRTPFSRQSTQRLAWRCPGGATKQETTGPVHATRQVLDVLLKTMTHRQRPAQGTAKNA